MKRVKSLLIIFLISATTLFGCTQPYSNESTAPNALSPSFVADGIIYYGTGEEVSVKEDEAEILGTIASVISISELPSENGQANIPFLGAPYVKYEEGLALLMDNKWFYFETREN